jgi:hypothetical protein
MNKENNYLMLRITALHKAPAVLHEVPAALPKISADPQKIPADPQKVSADPQKVSADPQKIPADPQKIPADPQKIPADPQKVSADPPNASVDPPKIPAGLPKIHVALPRIMIWMAATLCMSCSEEFHSPLNEGGGAPAPVSNPVAESLPGAARISYDMPDDRNLLYIKARAEIRPGVFREKKASSYTGSLVMDGFGDVAEHTVYLYSAGRNGLQSEGIPVKVKPDTPPVSAVFKSVAESVAETFGGIKFSISNPSEASVRIFVNTSDSLGEMAPVEIFYTSAVADNFSVRGFDSIPRKFSIHVQDRWGNSSETYENTFRPWMEEKLNKTKFTGIELPGDMTNNIQQGRVITRLWDEGLTDNTMYMTNSGIKPLPHTFTVDLGVKAILSRIVVNGRVSTNTLYLYNAGMPRQWEIYGSVQPGLDGSWDAWIPLRSSPCMSFKPSGLPAGQHTEDDYQRQVKGEEFEFDNMTPVRYIRFSVNEVWGGASTSFCNMTEITLHGTIIEKY